MDSATFSRPLFQCAGVDWFWRDALGLAAITGKLSGLLNRLTAGIQNATQLETPAAVELQELMDAFRYRFDLLAASEVHQWLSQRGLTLEDVRNALVRQVLAPHRTRREKCAPPHPLPGGLQLLWADTAVRGELDELTADLALRVATELNTPVEKNMPSDPAQPPELTQLRKDCPAWYEMLGEDRLKGLVQLEAQFNQLLIVCSTPEKQNHILARNRRDFMRFDLEYLTFSSPDAAAEAELCHKLDGLSLAEIAEEAGVRQQSDSVLAVNLPPDLAETLLTAAPGDTFCQADTNQMEWRVYRLKKKKSPTADDPDIALLLRRQLAEEYLIPCIREQITWQIPPPPTWSCRFPATP